MLSYLGQAAQTPLSPGTLGTIRILSLGVFHLSDCHYGDQLLHYFILASRNCEIIHFWEAWSLCSIKKEFKCIVHTTILLSKKGCFPVELEPMEQPLSSFFPMPGIVQLPAVG